MPGTVVKGHGDPVNSSMYSGGATSERTAAEKTEKLIFRAFFSTRM